MLKPDQNGGTTPAVTAAPPVPADPYGWRQHVMTRADQTFCDRAGVLVRAIGYRSGHNADQIEMERECFRMVVAMADLYRPSKRCRDGWACALSAWLVGEEPQ